MRPFQTPDGISVLNEPTLTTHDLHCNAAEAHDEPTAGPDLRLFQTPDDIGDLNKYTLTTHELHRIALIGDSSVPTSDGSCIRVDRCLQSLVCHLSRHSHCLRADTYQQFDESSFPIHRCLQPLMRRLACYPHCLGADRGRRFDLWTDWTETRSHFFAILRAASTQADSSATPPSERNVSQCATLRAIPTQATSIDCGQTALVAGLPQ